MRHLDLFSGIGGFALAFKMIWPDGEIAAFCEKDKYCQQILSKRFERPVIDDIKNIKENLWGKIDILTGGFPCQPFSLSGANKRRGTEDDRWLWPEMFRVIRITKPRWVVAENVYGFVGYKDGMVFEQVCTDLEGQGYDVGSFVIPACAIDAPHRRDRVWIVGYAERSGCDGVERRRAKQEPADRCTDVADAYGQRKSQPKRGKQNERRRPCHGGCEGVIPDPGSKPIRAGFRPVGQEEQRRGQSGNGDRKRIAADSDGQRLQEPGKYIKPVNSKENKERKAIKSFNGCIARWPVEPGICRVAYGIPKRVDRLRGLGNAIVPQVAAAIFRVIKEVELRIPACLLRQRCDDKSSGTFTGQ